MCRLLPIVAALGCLASAQAADLPAACTLAHAGAQTCMTQQVCTCAYDDAGALSGRSAGWRWSCDIMQMCDSDAPADLAAPAAPAWSGPMIIAPNIVPPLPSRP